MLQIFTIAEMDTAVKNLMLHLGSCTTVAFRGSMGAGKTTFISALCKAFGVVNIVSSPTYSIINQYETTSGQTIYHMDWYRLKDEEEALSAGVEEALYSGNLCLIEWPEKAEGLLPEDTFYVTIEAINNDTRSLTLHKKE